MPESSTTMTMKLNSSLFDIPIIKNVLAYDSISSTNLHAKVLAKRGSVDGTLVIAASQTAGKGRMGRSFTSPKDEGIYMSLMLRPNISPSKRSSLTLVTALAVAEAISKICPIKPKIKWPNDIVINGKKLVGILTEAGPDYVVIGIGVNVNNTSFPDDISATATSIFMETGTVWDNFQLLSRILSEFNKLYESFLASEDLSFMIDSYNSLLVSMNSYVYLIPHSSSSHYDNPYTIPTQDLEPVLCMGIDIEGNMIYKNKKGQISQINSGEVSLRGIQGYSE